MSTDVQKTIFNKEDYILDVTIIEQNQRGETDPKTFKIIQPLLNSNIRRMEIIQDIKNPLMVANISFTDTGYQIFPKISVDGRTFCLINIKKLKSDFGVEYVFSEVFLISDVKLLSKRDNSADYKLDMVHYDILKYNNYVYYSSKNERPHTEIISNLFDAGELPLDKSNIKPTLRTGFFVTPPTYSLFSSLTYNLKRCIHSESSLYYICYDNNIKKYKLISLKDILQNPDKNIIKQNILILPTGDYTGPVNFIMNDIQEQNYHDFNTNLELIKPVELKKYNYTSRAWSTLPFTRDTLFNNVFPKPNNPLDKNFPNSISQFVPLNIRNDIKPKLFLEYDFYNDLSDLFLLHDVLQFKCYGDLRRYPGQFINVSLQSTSVPLYEKYVGNWFIQRIYNAFVDGQFISTMQVCRINEKITK